ncbi:MAG: TRAP transporter substrate-binding protein DctP [Dethiobacteria bacterium]
MLCTGCNLLWLEGTGAVGVESPIPDAYTCLQTGVYDVSLQPSASVIKTNIFEVADYFVQVDFGTILCGGPTINLDIFNSLPEEVQQVIVEVGREYTMVQAKMAQEDYEKQMKVLEDSGINMTVFPHEEKEKWTQMLPNYPMKFAEEMDKLGYKGTELIVDYLEMVEEAGYMLPRKWHLE